MKHITVYGANGKVGSLVVRGLLERGHHVTAFVHHNRGMIPNEQLKIVEGDIHNQAVVEAALQGTDAVISCLGSWHTLTKDILTSGMKSIVPAMQKQGIARVVSLTGAETRAVGDKLTLLHRLSHVGIAAMAPKILRDGEEHIKLLEASDLKWTVVRSPIMSRKGGHGYHLSMKRPRPWQTIEQAAVAEAMIQQLNDSRHFQKAPFISR